MFCTKCGNELAEGSVFCNRCGAPVGKSKAAETQNPAQFGQTVQNTAQNTMQPGQAVQGTAQPDINWGAQEQKQYSQKKSIPKIAVVLPVCIVFIAIIVFGVLAFRDSSRTTPFTEYLSLVGGDYKELYSDEYDVTQPSEYLDYYYEATTDISLMDIDGTGAFYFFHTEDEEILSSLAESGIENDTVLRFWWSCDASVYSLDDVCAAFESIYGDSPMHGTYSFGLTEDTEYTIESYCWENAEGGYDLELYFLSEGDAIVASWSAHPDVEGSYEDVVSALEKALEDRDVAAYENLLYEGDALSASGSLKGSITDFLSSEGIDQIDCSIGEAVKVTAYAHSYLLAGNYSLSYSNLERIESLYVVNVDLTLYQDESIIFEASCKIDIAYIDGEWKIIGMFLNERLSDELLVELARQYYEYVHGSVPPIVEVDHYDGDSVVIHLYETNDGATATWDWYTIDPYTCEGTDFWGNEIYLYEAFAMA